jgi:uncharacterized protein (TIGR00661 family)
MKILYSVQATGNGHISRARDVLPYLQKFGDVDVFLSGSNAHLQIPLPVKYRSKGISLFYNSHGGLNYAAILNNVNLIRIYKEAMELPVKKYDIVLNDYECVTSLACKFRRTSSLHFGHQASYISDKVPRPEKIDRMGEFILKNYAGGTGFIGLHFWPYDANIYTPILRNEILQGKAQNNGKILVYLSQYSAENTMRIFQKFPEFQFQVFSKEVTSPRENENVALYPIDAGLFTEKLLSCHGIITGAGFETPAEALFLNKKLMVIPIQAQYEQICNAAALKEWQIPVLGKLADLDGNTLRAWYDSKNHREFQLLYTNEEIVNKAVESALLLRG